MTDLALEGVLWGRMWCVGEGLGVKTRPRCRAEGYTVEVKVPSPHLDIRGSGIIREDLDRFRCKAVSRRMSAVSGCDHVVSEPCELFCIP